MGKEVPASAEVLRPPERADDTGQFPLRRPSARDTPESLVRSSAVMSLGTALSRVTGFLRLAAMTYALGVTESRLADAYNVANTTPNIVYELALGGIISSVFVPVFVQRLEREGRDQAWHTARNVLTVATVLLAAVTLGGILAAEPIVRAYTARAQGPEAEAQRALASFLLRWFMPQVVFYGLGAGIATGLLNAHRRFGAPMFAPIANNLVATATFFLFAALPGGRTPDTLSTAQRYVLALGTTLGVVAMTAALWPSLRRIGFRWRWTLDLEDPGLARILRLSGWAVLYVVVNQLGLLVVIVLAGEVRGGYSAYAAAFIFFQLPHAIFAVSIMTALLPALSSRWARGDRASFRDQLAQGIRGTAFIVLPAALGYLTLAGPIVRLLLENGVAGAASTRLVASVLQAFAVGLLSFSAFQLFLRAFYAMQDTRTPALVNVAAVAINTGANLLYVRFLSVPGLALGHATAYTFAAVTAGLLLRRRLGGLGGRGLLLFVLKVLAGSVAAAGVALLVARGVEESLGVASLGAQLLQVLGGVGAGVAVYFGVAAALHLPELQLVTRVIRRAARPAPE
ncbi:MAG TPA: murein biosynthesis integral membrane protein MurJ [Actinomycetota bacterium]|nr:murein biosynthesis integral membrane protein MurJ [Actinomycetota bacterium]